MGFRFWWQTETKEVSEQHKESKPAVQDNGIMDMDEVGIILDKWKKRNVYWCFQGIQYEDEQAKGYIFAGNKSSISHWWRLWSVKKGDLIVHVKNDEIKAISVVKENCRLEDRPLVHYGMSFPRNNPKGLYVETEYNELRAVISWKQYRQDIQKMLGADYYGKGYPFNKNGLGNQGYLYNLNQEMIKFFMAKILKRNPYLKQWLSTK